MNAYTFSQLQTARAIVGGAERDGLSLSELGRRLDREIAARMEGSGRLAPEPDPEEQPLCPDCGGRMVASGAALDEGFIALTCPQCRKSYIPEVYGG